MTASSTVFLFNSNAAEAVAAANLALLSMTTTTTNDNNNHISQDSPAVAAATVHVQIMSESLCIDSQHFYEQQFFPTYHTLGPSLMNVELVPFGNSHINTTTKTVTCQHGPAECDANTWQQCAVTELEEKEYMTFMDCLEQVLPMGYREELLDESIFQHCLDLEETVGDMRSENDNDDAFSKVKACHDDPNRAWELQQQFAAMTPTDHTYVPWVLLEGMLVDVEHEDFLQRVCQAIYQKGGDDDILPAACASTTLYD